MIEGEHFNAEEILAGILPWVEVESPTHHAAGVNRMMDLAAQDIERLGGSVERTPGRDGHGDIVVGRIPGREGHGNPTTMLLAHVDTVHPVGTLAGRLKVRRDGDRAYGPGIYDMKGGCRIAVHALGVLRRLDRMPRQGISFMFIPDEEVGSPTSRGLIETEARRHARVLVVEPCKNGVIVTGRFAFQRFWVAVHGRPAHAGANNRDGRSAIRAMAALVERIEGMTDFNRGMTFSVGIIEGGTFVNVMPILCRAQVLTVAPTEAIFAEVAERMMALAGERDGVRIEVTRGPVRPLWQPNKATMALYDKARAVAATLDIELRHGSFGGGSDGNFTGALGVATLDGLGVDGAGAHTFEEHLLVSSLVPRCRLLAELMASLE